MYTDFRDESSLKSAKRFVCLMTPVVLIMAIVINLKSNKVYKTEACIISIESILNTDTQLKVHYKFITEEAEYIGIECIDTSLSNYYKIGDTVQIQFKKKNSSESHILTESLLN